MGEVDAPALEIGPREAVDRLFGSRAEGHETVRRIRDFKRQVLSLVIGIEGSEISERDPHRAALRNGEVEITADRGWNVAHLSRELATLLHRQAAAFDRPRVHTPTLV